MRVDTHVERVSKRYYTLHLGCDEMASLRRLMQQEKVLMGWGKLSHVVREILNKLDALDEEIKGEANAG